MHFHSSVSAWQGLPYQRVGDAAIGGEGCALARAARSEARVLGFWSV